MSGPAPSLGTDGPGRLRRLAGEVPALRVVRQAVFLSILLLVWVSLKPFPSLSRPDLGDIVTGQEGATYLAFGAGALVALGVTLREHARGLASLLTPANAALGLWLVLSVVLSTDPGTSAKRLGLTMAVIAVAACLPLLPASRGEWRALLGLAAGTLLALCYLGLLLAPDLAIHGPRDLLEPGLAGAWRGVFGHKNAAAAVIAMLVFVGLAVFRSGQRATGAGLTAASALFLVGSEGKSAAALCLAVLAITGLFSLLRGLLARAALTLGLVLVLNLFSVGTVLNDGLARIVATLPLDATFTGRTDVWRFAVDAVAQRPLTGYGFSAFWGTSGVRDSAEAEGTWAGVAAHSHNGYLDTAVNLGLVGLVLTGLVLVIAPLRDYQRLSERSRPDPFAVMFLQIWLFGLLLSSMESFFYDRSDPIWFTFLVAVFGLHYLARFRLG